MTVPILTIDSEEAVARRIVWDLVEGDLDKLLVKFLGLRLEEYDVIEMNMRKEDLEKTTRFLLPTATHGYVQDLTTVFPCPDQGGKTIIVPIDGGAPQTITFVGITTQLQDILDQINSQLVGATAQDVGYGRLEIVSDSAGSESSVGAPSGTSDFVWETPVVGAGDPEQGEVTWQPGDLVKGRHQIEFQFTAGVTIFTLPRRYPVVLSVRRELD